MAFGWSGSQGSATAGKSTGTSAAAGYGQAARSMSSVGVSGVGGGSAASKSSSGTKSSGGGSTSKSGGYGGAAAGSSSGKASSPSTSKTSGASGGAGAGRSATSTGSRTGGGSTTSASKGTSAAAGYQGAARSMSAGGIGSVGGKQTGSTATGAPAATAGRVGTGTSPAAGYNQAASTMGKAGISSVGGRQATTGATPGRMANRSLGTVGDTYNAANVDPNRYGPATGTTAADIDPTRFGTPAKATVSTRTTTPIANINPARFGPASATSGNPADAAAAATGVPTRSVATTTVPGTVSANIDPTRFGPTATTAATATPTIANADIDPNRFGPATGVDIDPARFGPTTTPTTRSIGAADTAAPKGFSAAVSGPVTPTGTTMGSLKAGTVTPMGTNLSSLADTAKAPVSFEPGVTAPRSDVLDKAAAGVADVLGAENVRLHVTSTQRTKNAAPGRHPVGKAADMSIQVKGPDGWHTLNMGDRNDLNTMHQLAIGMTKRGVQGIGYGDGYMHNGYAHVDVTENPGKGQGFTWSGPKATGKTNKGANEIAGQLATERANYAANKNKTSTSAKSQQPVASMMASDDENTAQTTALNEMSGATKAKTSQTTTSKPAQAAASSVDKTTTQSTRAAVAAKSPTTKTTTQTTKAATAPATTAPRGFLSQAVDLAAATGIDVLTGTNPVGMVANLATMLTTGKSLGGTIVSAARGGTNTYSPGDQSQRQGGGDTRLPQEKTEAEKDRATETKTESTAEAAPAESFTSKYIDPPGTPTPAEKWQAYAPAERPTEPIYDFTAPEATDPFTFV